MDISKTFALNAKITRLPCSSADKYRCIAVTEQIFYLKNCADGCIRTDHNAHFCHFISVAFQNRFRQTEFRDAVLHDTTNLVFPFKNSYAISLLCKKNSCCHTCRSCTDHCHFLVFFLNRFYFHTVQISIGNVGFNAGKMYRISFSSKHAVTCTLHFMVTDNRADYGHWIVLEELLSCFHDLVLFEHLDDLWNWSMYRTSLLTSGFLAV